MRNFFLFLLVIALNIEAQTGNIITVNVENDAVMRFLKEVSYTSTDDSTQIRAYRAFAAERGDYPRPAIIPIPEADADMLLKYSDSEDASEREHIMVVAKGSTEVKLYNLTPQRTYYYVIECDGQILGSGEIHTTGQVRMIRVPGADNIRDMGGWPTVDGKRIKYGKLIRGGELNGNHNVDSASLAILSDRLDIKAEIDMRAFYDKGKGVSAFGFASNQWGNGSKPPYYYTNDSGQLPEHLQNTAYKRKWKREFDFIVNNFVKGRNVYFHCVRGADRTGYLALFMEGLLGVGYEDMIKDYELTYFTNGNTKKIIDPVINYISQLKGTSLQERFNTFFVDSLGVYQQNIDYFRKEMLEDIPEEIHLDKNNPITFISNTVQTDDQRKATVVDLWGRKATVVTNTHSRPSLHKGIVIEIAPDGTVRKRVR